MTSSSSSEGERSFKRRALIISYSIALVATSVGAALVLSGGAADAPVITSAPSQSDDGIRIVPLATGPGDVVETVGTLTYRDPDGNVSLVRDVNAYVGANSDSRVRTESRSNGAGDSVEHPIDDYEVSLTETRFKSENPDGSVGLTIDKKSGTFVTDATIWDEVEYDGNVVVYGLASGPGGSITYEASIVNRNAPAEKLRVSVPPDAEVTDLREGRVSTEGRVVQVAIASVTKNMNSILGGVCLEAYNFRNNVSTYYGTSSRSKAVCDYVQVNVWRNGWAYGSSTNTCLSPWFTVGPKVTTSSNVFTYVVPYSSQYAVCSKHAGWNNALLVVAWIDQAAAISG